jgi:TolB-like protein/Tfp pilus assembly protein PilF
VNSGNFFSELKRRNVYKVAVAYIVAGWALSQGIAQVFPVFDIPNWAIRLIVLLIILGLPIAIALAWMFEITPQGIRRTETADTMPSVPGQKKHAWIYVVVIGAAISIALFFLGRYTAGNRTAATAPNDIPSKSIAVLPFDSLSEDKSNAYFAEGVQDEILTRLAKVADLKVISRTSTQRFKSAPSDLRDIAKQLGVMNILEGSVQKANDQVRVNVQLINAMNDAHLWAEIYDRKLTDIFATESDIAKAIAETLQAKLTGSEITAISKKPTANPEAYELYLKGRFFWNKRTGADLFKAIDYFNQAIAKDPNYALAYSGLADSYLLLPPYGAAAPKDSIPQAKAAVKKALELDDTLAEAHASSGRILSGFDFDSTKAIAGFERAIELNPNYATAHHWFGAGPLLALGRFDESIVEAKRSIELDPLSMINNADFGNDYYYARRYDEAIAQLHKTIEIEPRFYLAHYYLAQALQMKGQLAEAIAEYRKAVELDDDPFALALLGQAYARSGQRDEANKILVRLNEEAKTRYVAAYGIGAVFLGMGDKNRAMDELERAYRENDGNDIYNIRVDPLLDDLRGNLRFEALAEKIIPAKEFGVTKK